MQGTAGGLEDLAPIRNARTRTLSVPKRGTGSHAIPRVSSPIVSADTVAFLSIQLVLENMCYYYNSYKACVELVLMAGLRQDAPFTILFSCHARGHLLVLIGLSLPFSPLALSSAEECDKMFPIHTEHLRQTPRLPQPSSTRPSRFRRSRRSTGS